MIERDLTACLQRAAGSLPAVTLTGPRQSGKSTLCHAVFGHLDYANLEAPDVRAFATEDPRGFLAQYPEGAVIDEIQRCPELPSYLQEIIDAQRVPGRWVLTGSQSLNLFQPVSQSLAGRTAVLHLLPLARSEVVRFAKHPRSLDEAMLTGGYPRILDQDLVPADWLGGYVSTYLERDVRTISNIGDLVTFQRFVELCAARTGQLLNLLSLASDCGISQPTAKAWLSILEATFIVFRLPSFSRNIGKRLVKMPKLHFYDTGLVCWLLGIRTVEQLRTHPLRGSIFETWVVSEVAKSRHNRGERSGLYFYRDRHGAELDLVVENGMHLQAVEAKAGQTVTPELLRGSHRALDELRNTYEVEPYLVYGGDRGQQRTDLSVLAWHAVQDAGW